MGISYRLLFVQMVLFSRDVDLGWWIFSTDVDVGWWGFLKM